MATPSFLLVIVVIATSQPVAVSAVVGLSYFMGVENEYE